MASSFDQEQEHKDERPATERQTAAVNRFFGEATPSDLTFTKASRMLSAYRYVQAVDALYFKKHNLTLSQYTLRESALDLLKSPRLSRYVELWNKRRWVQGPENHIPRKLRETPEMVEVINLMGINFEAFDI